jgi:hypothetical protein
MKLRMGLVLTCAGLLMACGANPAPAALITQWTFPTTSGSNNSPAPTVGSGVATVLGMDNTYTFSSNNTITGSGTFIPGTIDGTVSTASADILATGGDPNGFANAWRVRGPSNNNNGPGGLGNGWALQAPQYTQGAQFAASTVGFTNVKFSFDWFTTTQGVKNMQEEYTLDGTNWIKINGLLTAVSNNFAPTQTIDFSGISGANNNSKFGVRLVSAYDPTLTGINAGN